MTDFPTPKPGPHRLRLAYAATAILAAVIAWGTLSPPSDGGSGLPLSDKQIHALAFALLVLPIALVDLRRALRATPLMLAFGAAIELIQPGFGRSGEWADLAADGVGLILGLAGAWATWVWRRRRAGPT